MSSASVEHQYSVSNPLGQEIVVIIGHTFHIDFTVPVISPALSWVLEGLSPSGIVGLVNIEREHAPIGVDRTRWQFEAIKTGEAELLFVLLSPRGNQEERRIKVRVIDQDRSHN
jgi:hypothetical protein